MGILFNDRPKKTWKKFVESSLKRMDLSVSDALDRKKWRNLIRGGKGDSGEGSSDIERSVFCLIWYRLTGVIHIHIFCKQMSKH